MLEHHGSEASLQARSNPPALCKTCFPTRRGYHLVLQCSALAMRRLYRQPQGAKMLVA